MPQPCTRISMSVLTHSDSDMPDSRASLVAASQVSSWTRTLGISAFMEPPSGDDLRLRESVIATYLEEKRPAMARAKARLARAREVLERTPGIEPVANI